MEKKKFYEAPSVRKVRLDIKTSVMGDCFSSANIIAEPICQVPNAPCISPLANGG